MQNNWGNFSKVGFFAMCKIFRSSKGEGAWPKWPNGKYAYALDINKLNVFIQPGDDVVTRNWNQKVNKSSGLHCFDIFKNSCSLCDHSRYASGFHDVKVR